MMEYGDMLKTNHMTADDETYTFIVAYPIFAQFAYLITI